MHLKAEIWDQVQYIFRNYYDRMIHCASYYDGEVDVKALRKSMHYILEHYPVLRSTFKPSSIKPHWSVNEDYCEEETVGVVYCDDLEKSVFASLSEEIDWSAKFQYRLTVHYCGGKSAISLIVNHMCMDGADFKYFVSKIAEGYNIIMQGGELSSLVLKSGDRGAGQLYKDMSEEDAKAAKELMKNVSRTGVKNKFAFTDDEDCKVFFTCKKLKKEYVAKLKERGKQLDATLNDVLVTAYARAISRYIEKSDDPRIAVTCMKNLRDHIKSGESEDLTNLTGFMPCVLDKIEGTFEDTLASVAAKTKEAKDDKFCGLYGLPLMALAFKVFPYSLAEFAIKIGYENPLIGMSNIGVIPEDAVALYGVDCYDTFMTGATKKKPYIQLTATTYRGETTLCIAQKCSQNDKEIIDKFFDEIIGELGDFQPIA
ncbi:MAG: hypothetical protein K2G37_01740 [Clostridia bacterium]|nr:hypothetical protein [Clostridia bacterium]MDE7329207.1 hypothetical protein [Clostridia bacterium]